MKTAQVVKDQKGLIPRLDGNYGTLFFSARIVVLVVSIS